MNVKGIIKRHGYTIEKVADILSNTRGTTVTKGSLSHTINHGNPTIGYLQQIANVIGASRAEFFEDEVPQPIAPTPPEFVGDTTINGKRYGLVELPDESSST